MSMTAGGWRAATAGGTSRRRLDPTPTLRPSSTTSMSRVVDSRHELSRKRPPGNVPPGVCGFPRGGPNSEPPATPSVRLVVRQALLLATLGVAVGIGGAAVATRLLESSLFGVTTTDPSAFVLGVVVLGGVAIVASYLPGPACNAGRSLPSGVILGWGGGGGNLSSSSSRATTPVRECTELN